MTGIPFPNNVTLVLVEHLGTIDTLSKMHNPADPDDAVGIPAIYARPLRPSDPAVSIGVMPVDFASNLDSIEFSSNEPTLNTYVWAVQNLVKDSNEETGMLMHGLVSKAIRAMLYRDTALRVALSELSENSLGITERTQRWGVRQQRYANNEIDGVFTFLSTTDFWVETESV